MSLKRLKIVSDGQTNNTYVQIGDEIIPWVQSVTITAKVGAPRVSVELVITNVELQIEGDVDLDRLIG